MSEQRTLHLETRVGDAIAQRVVAPLQTAYLVELAQAFDFDGYITHLCLTAPAHARMILPGARTLTGAERRGQ